MVKEEDIKEFRESIYPYWSGKSMEDVIKNNYGKEINAMAKVVKINQKDHAQGHICPDSELWLKFGPQGLIDKAKEKMANCEENQKEFYECTIQKDHAQGHICPDSELWLKFGPQGLIDKAKEKMANCEENQKEFYECTILVLEGAKNFMMRYHDYILNMINNCGEDKIEDKYKESLRNVTEICKNLSERPPKTFHEAVQSLWFFFTILHLESNASSFTPVRMDKY